jgi:hypothetical protein
LMLQEEKPRWVKFRMIGPIFRRLRNMRPIGVSSKDSLW